MAGRFASPLQRPDHRRTCGEEPRWLADYRPRHRTPDRPAAHRQYGGPPRHLLCRPHLPAPPHSRYRQSQPDSPHRAHRESGTHSRRGLGLCRLHRRAFSRDSGSRQALRKEQLRSGIRIHPPIHRQGPVGFGHRLCCDPRPELLPPLCGPGRRRRAESRCRGRQVGHEPGRFAIRQLHPQLHPPRLQSGRKRQDCLGWRNAAHRRAPVGAQFPLCRCRRGRGTRSARQRIRPMVERLRG